MADAGGRLGLEQVRDNVVKNSSTAASSNDGEFDTSTTTDAPCSASASPSPVMVLTPVLGAAASGSWPCSRSRSTTFAPSRPVPPMTTIFIVLTTFVMSRSPGAPVGDLDRPRRRTATPAPIAPPRTQPSRHHRPDSTRHRSHGCPVSISPTERRDSLPEPAWTPNSASAARAARGFGVPAPSRFGVCAQVPLGHGTSRLHSFGERCDGGSWRVHVCVTATWHGVVSDGP